MLNKINWKGLSNSQQKKVLQRPVQQNMSLAEKTAAIIADVRAEGDIALKKFTQQFDQVQLEKIQVTEEEFVTAEKNCSSKVKDAIQQAAEKIEMFHRAQYPQNLKVETGPGINCELQYRPLKNVGLYVPGGSATLPSAALMLGIPAKIAGCDRRILCSPPQKDGQLNAAVLVAARYCGINDVFKIGGAQAIAAMAYGTLTIPKVNKIFGPGNSWVTQAKILVATDPEGAFFDAPAGPTEQLVIADNTANPAWIAADLLSQAEHGADSQVIFITDQPELIDRVNQQIKIQLATLPRKDIAQQALQNSTAILVDTLEEAITIANDYAPEHLLLQIAEPRHYLSSIRHAGSVFLGHYAPESVGDYASGTNHVLPTYGYARALSGLGVLDFMQRITFQELTESGLASIATTVETLAAAEELEGHRRAVEIRNVTHLPKVNTVLSVGQAMVQKLARPEIITLTPYSSARREQNSGEIFLNANENPWDEENSFNRYPQPQPLPLLQQLSQIYQVPIENVLMTRGSDEGIDLLIRAFCNAGRDAIMVTPPSYGMYSVTANIQNASIVPVPLLKESGFNLNVTAILECWRPQVKLIFLCSPNNPTGNLLSRENILEICQKLQNQAIVVVDEAYIEYATIPSLCEIRETYPNLVILRTLSKAHSLAALRCGVVIADAAIISLLQKVIAPYPIPTSTIQEVSAALTPENLKNRMQKIEIIRQQRQFLTQKLSEFSFVKQIWPSDANFLLLEVDNSKAVLQYCLQHGIVIRDRSAEYNLQNCVRITVGTPEQNKFLLETMGSYGVKNSSRNANLSQ